MFSPACGSPRLFRAPNLSARHHPRARFPSQLDGRLLQTIHPFTEGDSATKGENCSHHLSGMRPKRVLPKLRLTLKTCDRPNLFPARMIRALFSSAPKIVGLWGRTRVPRADTPSLNPGLWYNWYPPIASRRQAKKTRKVWNLKRLNLAFEGQVLLVPSSMYGGTSELDVRQIA